MRTRFLLTSALLAIVALAGCGRAEREIVAPQPLTPLTREEWRAMTDFNLKYDPLSFERLQLGDPSLRSDAAWNRFFEQVVVPERKKDIPTG